MFHSEELDHLWSQGRTTHGPVTYETAAYVARYSLKKITGPDADAHYQGRLPEYLTMSRRPGLGTAWLDKYHQDVYTSDAVILRGGTKIRPPRFYDSKIPPRLLARIKLQRNLKARTTALTGRELINAEVIQEARLSNLHRNYEEP